jgi:hypothetical protein
MIDETRYRIGHIVRDGDGRNCQIVHHGRDTKGIYSEVRYLDGKTDRWHRSSLHPHIHAGAGDCDCHYFPTAATVPVDGIAAARQWEAAQEEAK